ncbi:MAG: DUF1580 domain-containing protein [Planctomycetaceae bacterium]|nr:DUF1580 domain-containing protein [Planctomycetaceae bacterium]
MDQFFKGRPQRDACQVGPNISTLHRWRLHGVRGHKLETVLVGGRRFTSDEALERFIARTTAAGDGEKSPVRSHANGNERAERELAQDGL